MDKTAEVRNKLGELVKNLDDEQLKEEITKFELLSECIIDQAEKELFDGKILSELISDFIAQKNNFLTTEDQ